MRGKRALVTGSTSGIGLGIARVLAGHGANLVLNGLGDAAEIEKLRSSLAAEFGVEIAYDSADMTKPDQIRAMAARSGPVDILICNAGIQYVAPVEDFPIERWDAIIAINLSAAFHAMAACIPGMRQRGWGRIINIASAHGKVASAGKSAYVAAKHGIVGLTKAAAVELANSGVTVNAICPGWVHTPLVEKQLQDRASREGRSLEQVTHALLAEKQPLLEFSTPEQIGEMAAYLCSDQARTVTGAAMSIDGGWTAV